MACSVLVERCSSLWLKDGANATEEFPQLLCRMFLQPLHKVASGQLCFATAIGQCWDLHKVAIVAASS